MPGPSGETLVGACPKAILDHQHQIERDISNVLDRIIKTKSTTVTKAPIQSLLLSIQKLFKKLEQATPHADITARLSRIEESTKTTAERVGQITTNLETISTTAAHKVQPPTWANVASYDHKAPRIQHQQLHPAPDDCMITIKNISPTKKAELQKTTSADIRTRVNRAIKDSNQDPIKLLSVLGAKSLASGDVAVFTANAKDAQTLRDHNKHWATCLSPQATTLTPTFSIIVHGIKTSTIDLTNKELLTERWTTENAVLYGDLDIKQIAWLRKDIKGDYSCLVLSLADRVKRDEIVTKNRLYWQGSPHQVEEYNLKLRILQCLRCCKYKHTVAQCRSHSPACNYCSESHLGADCPHKADPTAKKCALCKGPHVAYAKCCKYRIEQEQEKAGLKALSRASHQPQLTPLAASKP
ncbi:MAG: hypothetical protein MMC33_008423, partial [Icmadophila ericetorum]|nr:hypothetical protein [Icmadophila ericetorum]